MNEYKVYTKSNWWRIEADDDVEAMRKALWFCYRDDEEFVKIVRENYHSPGTALPDRRRTIIHYITDISHKR